MKEVGVQILSSGKGVSKNVDYSRILFNVLCKSTTLDRAEEAMRGLKHMIVNDLDLTNVQVKYYFDDSINIQEDELIVDLR